MRYAVLLRGEPFRWGCTEMSRYLQHLCTKSLHSNVIQPLEHFGHVVEVYVSLNRQSPPCISDYHAELARSHGAHLRSTISIISNNQEENVVAVFGWLFATVPRDSFDYLIFVRYDMRFLTPITMWRESEKSRYDHPNRTDTSWEGVPQAPLCHDASSSEPQPVAFASRTSRTMWKAIHATMDTFYIFPVSMLDIVNHSFGISENDRHSCCFSRYCKPATYCAHQCYNSIAPHVIRRNSTVRFCWSPPDTPRTNIWHLNAIAPNGPDYQCCGKPSFNWSQVYALEVARESAPNPAAAAAIPASYGRPVSCRLSNCFQENCPSCFGDEQGEPKNAQRHGRRLALHD